MRGGRGHPAHSRYDRESIGALGMFRSADAFIEADWADRIKAAAVSALDLLIGIVGFKTGAWDKPTLTFGAWRADVRPATASLNKES